MRFRFCGDLDCPDWVLAEINILARLTSVKMKLIVVQVIKGLLGEDGIDFLKIEKLTSDAKFDVGDIKASVAGLEFIITSAARHEVDGETLANELQQLGLPKEHSGALCKSYESKTAELHEALLGRSFRRSSCLQNVDWKLNDDSSRSVDLRIELKNPSNKKTELLELNLTESKFKVLLHEMRQVQSNIKQLEI